MTQGEYLGILLDDGRLYQSSEWDVDGGVKRSQWVYNCDLSGPTTTIRQTFPRRRVLHVLVDPSPREPWYGVSPAKRAGVTADLAGLLESALRTDAQTPVKQIIPQPEGATDPTIAALEMALKDGATRLAMPPTTQAAYSEGRSSAPAQDWQPRRLGPDPTIAEVQLAGEAQARMLAAYGVHPSVMDPKATAGALREAHRQTQIDLIEPLGKLVEEAVSEFVERQGHDPVAAAERRRAGDGKGLRHDGQGWDPDSGRGAGGGHQGAVAGGAEAGTSAGAGRSAETGA